MAGPAASAVEEPDIETAPLESERQRIEGRLDTIKRKLDDRGSRLIPVAPVLPMNRAADPATGVPTSDPQRSNDRRLDLERRELEQRRQAIDRDLNRMRGDANPSSGGLLERLRGD